MAEEFHNKKMQKPNSSLTTIDALNAGGLFFMLLSFIILAVLTYSLYQINFLALAFQPQTGGSGGSPGFNSEMSQKEIAEIVNFYLSRFLAPFMLFIAAFVAAIFGYSLLRTAGTATKQILPTQDYELLKQLLIDKNEEGINNYIRLSSLTGITGTFTKIGLSGLPLATIALTIFFALLGVITGGNEQLYDFAKLTLGAFIGSYVQRQVSEVSRVTTKKNDDSQ